MSGVRETAFVALGANMPIERSRRIATLTRAIEAIARDLALPDTLRVSAFYETPAYPVGIGADFVNACAAFETTRAAPELLAALHAIEAEAGRTRSKRWGERSLDLDLLALGGQVWPDVASQVRWRDLPLERQAREAPAELVLPHPRLQDRGFVLVPLAEIAPGWTHPVTGLTVTEMRDALPQAQRAGIAEIDRL
ncbi:2-amino-4-hydroxy-6-hydroxymethyldihydropteridine diphosphokinase [Salipiger sp. IMCC34102]|uniref:2-amino-4-hydroxy-6- hydroxymethyldihydropteridine diphosphokinase n=1 Tax=Salipiger sp. IMCC34102 TaxID=2510647 RepID=UPI00101BED0B|nr:2-amino-4-hydroxy-6-hydroxymethyldihydropteridine diphosphokinase [Salipiger sp. IMCC34102]RYH03891.1 2-amino-4-hydroxy-6-hydroxymethyldihydropteridine diphosphokinase [Salipiger sp. IMCC34102]